MGILQTIQTIAQNNRLFKTVIVKGLFAQLVAQSRVPVPHTGDTLEFVLATINIPANTLSATGRLKLTSLWKFIGAGGNRTCRVRLTNISGAILWAPVHSSAVLSATLDWMLWMMGATNSQESSGSGQTGYVGVSGAVVTAAIDTTQAWTLVITGQVAVGTDTISLEAYDLELCDTSV